MRQRMITGLIAGAVFIGVLLLGGYLFAGLIFIMGLIGFDEFLRMNKMGRWEPASLLGWMGLILLMGPGLGKFDAIFTPDQLIWLLMFLLLSVTVFTKNRITIDKAALLFIGVIYLGYGYASMIHTRSMESHSLFWTLFIFLCIWTTDSGAYFSGKFFGKNKLWPAISPNKTIEGALGGVVLAMIVAMVFHFIQPDVLGMGKALVLGAVIAVVGQLGDLIQSAYKRVKGIKDSGTILPGHGGILDRTDSWLIVFPFLYLFSLIP